MGVNILRYPGGKSKVVGRLVPLLGEVSRYYEPFVGGASMALEVASRFPAAELLLADADLRVANLWAVVASEDYLKLAARVEETVPTVDLFRRLKADPGDTALERAFSLLYLNRTAYSGKTHTSPVGGWEQTGRWKIDAEWRVAHILKNLAAAHSLLVGRTTVLAGSFTETWPAGPWTTYADPPYYQMGRSMYPISMADADHEVLAAYLQESDGPWLLSYDDCDYVRRLYDWARIEELTWTYSAGIRTRSAGEELIIHL